MGTTERSLTALKEHIEDIVIASNVHKLDPELVAAIVMTESSGNKYAIRYEPAFLVRYVEPTMDDSRFASCGHRITEKISRATSWGLMQVMGLVARENGFKGKFLSQLCNPKIGLDMGCFHFAKLLRRHDGDNIRGLLAYNGGSDTGYPARVDSWRREISESGLFKKS